MFLEIVAAVGSQKNWSHESEGMDESRLLDALKDFICLHKYVGEHVDHTTKRWRNNSESNLRAGTFY
jgi:hypothetical protein